MKIRMYFPVIVLVLALILSPGLSYGENKVDAKEKESMLEFTMKDIDGKDVELSKYKGQVLLVVNVASKCGLTPQYEQLVEIQKKYTKQGFQVLGFPANNFMKQEPGTNSEIKLFCKEEYEVNFDMFSKISVKGDDIHPLYKFLTNEDKQGDKGGEIRWNFDKFLVGRDGKVIGRFHPKTTPDAEDVVTAVEAAIKEKA